MESTLMARTPISAYSTFLSTVLLQGMALAMTAATITSGKASAVMASGDSGVILTAGARSSRPRMSGAISASTRYALAASRAMPRGMAQMAFLRFWRTRSCMEYSVPVTSDG